MISQVLIQWVMIAIILTMRKVMRHHLAERLITLALLQAFNVALAFIGLDLSLLTKVLLIFHVTFTIKVAQSFTPPPMSQLTPQAPSQ